MRTRWPRLVAAFLGLIWFLQIGGARALNPLYVAWLPNSDWMQHWLGWLMFRHEPWRFPFGTIAAMPYPIGTTIGFTDSNPLVSLLLKPFSGLMPAEIQFIGPWLALCFVLQGYMGALLASTVTDDKGQQTLAGYLFVLSPVLVNRIGHDTLCAHWLLLFLMYLGLREYPDEAAARRATWLGMAAVMLAASIHPYLAAMSFVLAQACYVRLWRARLVTPVRAVTGALLATAGMLAVFGVIGYFNGAGMDSPGFGTHAADLLALVEPGGFSYLLAFNTRDLPWEGLGYLGLGGLAACVIAIIVFVRERTAPRRGTWALIAAVVLMAVYAFSADLHLAGEHVMSLERLYRPFKTLTGPFRASGRFIWGLHYLALLFGVWGATRAPGLARRAMGTLVLAIAVVLQGADFNVDRSWSAARDFRRAPVKELELAAGKYEHLELFPMQVQGVCGTPYEEAHAYRYMLLAYQLKTTYNSGIFARLPAGRVAAECARLEGAVETGHLDSRTIYVVSPASYVPTFTRAGAACGRFDGDWFCVSRDSDEAFRTLLETGKTPTQSAR